MYHLNVLLVLIIIVCGFTLIRFTSDYQLNHFFVKRRKNALVYQETFDIPKAFIDEGKTHFSSERVIVCGLARNIEKTFSSLVETLKIFSSLFEDYLFIFVENDSGDLTRELLFSLKDDDISFGFKGENIHILKLDDKNALVVDDRNPWHLNLPVECGREKSRIDKMVFLRNVYMKYINEILGNVVSESYKYTAIIDCDSVTSHLVPQPFLSSSSFFSNYSFAERVALSGHYFKQDDPENNIHAIGANSVNIRNYKYYDGFSLDFYPDGVKSFTKGFTISTPLSGHYGDDLIKVKSCFGGFVIYKTEQIFGKYYSTHVRLDLISSHIENYKRFKFPICEHKPFNYLVDKIFINPRLLTFVDSW